MKFKAVVRYVVVVIGLVALAWMATATFFLGKSIWPLVHGSKSVTWGMKAGDLVVSAASGSVSYHLLPMALLVFVLPLGAIVVAGILLRDTPGRTLLATVGACSGVLVILVAAYLVTRPTPGRWVGRQLPSMAIKYVEAKPEFTGHPVLLEFWATWCGPCVASISHLNELQTKFRSSGLVIVGVSSEREAVVADFLKKNQVRYAIAVDSTGRLFRTFGVSAIPHAFLTDRRGTIIWEGHPYLLQDAQIAAASK
ncbi:MAG TPA: TlpA disulfide reductase family protein [Opitutaceae bacterium]|nr:TlpA disulfide reductase family protein [Opitutaceae bacterium]